MGAGLQGSPAAARGRVIARNKTEAPMAPRQSSNCHVASDRRPAALTDKGEVGAGVVGLQSHGFVRRHHRHLRLRQQLVPGADEQPVRLHLWHAHEAAHATQHDSLRSLVHSLTNAAQVCIERCRMHSLEPITKEVHLLRTTSSCRAGKHKAVEPSPVAHARIAAGTPPPPSGPCPAVSPSGR